MQFVILGFVENKGNKFGFDVKNYIRWFGFNMSLWGRFKWDKLGCFDRRSGDFRISEVLDSAKGKIFEVIGENPSWSTWIFSMEFLNKFL